MNSVIIVCDDGKRCLIYALVTQWSSAISRGNLGTCMSVIYVIRVFHQTVVSVIYFRDIRQWSATKHVRDRLAGTVHTTKLTMFSLVINNFLPSLSMDDVIQNGWRDFANFRGIPSINAPTPFTPCLLSRVAFSMHSRVVMPTKTFGQYAQQSTAQIYTRGNYLSRSSVDPDHGFNLFPFATHTHQQWYTSLAEVMALIQYKDNSLPA